MTDFEEFRKAHSNYSDVAAQKQATWEPVVAMLNREGWSPIEYLDFVFRTYKKPMVPSFLTAGPIVESYREARPAIVAEAERKAMWGMDQVRTRLANGFTVSDVLSDPELEHMATLLFLVASVDKNKEAAARLRDAAVYELSVTPSLREVYARVFDRRLLPC